MVLWYCLICLVSFINWFCVVQEISDLWNESALTGKELPQWQTGAIKMAVNLALLNWCVKVWNNALFYNEFYYRRISRLLFYKYLDKRVIEWPEASLILLIPLMYNRSRLRVIFLISNHIQNTKNKPEWSAFINFNVKLYFEH